MQRNKGVLSDLVARCSLEYRYEHDTRSMLHCFTILFPVDWIERKEYVGICTNFEIFSIFSDLI